MERRAWNHKSNSIVTGSDIVPGRFVQMLIRIGALFKLCSIAAPNSARSKKIWGSLVPAPVNVYDEVFRNVVAGGIHNLCCDDLAR